MTSLIAQAQQLLPQAVHDARDQELTWAQIGELLGTNPHHSRPTLPEPAMNDHASLTRITGIMPPSALVGPVSCTSHGEDSGRAGVAP